MPSKSPQSQVDPVKLLKDLDTLIKSDKFDEGATAMFEHWKRQVLLSQASAQFAEAEKVKEIVENAKARIEAINAELLSTASDALPDKRRDTLIAERNMWQSFTDAVTGSPAALEVIATSVSENLKEMGA